MNDLPNQLPSFLRDLPPVVLWSLAGIFGLLVVATTIVWLLGRAKPGLDLGEVRQRVRSWWVMAGVFAFAMAVDRRISLVFFAFVSFLALKEYLSLIPTRRADRRVLFWAYLAVPIQYWWIHVEWYFMFIIFVPVYVFLFIPLRMVLIGETSGFLRAVGTLHWGMMATVFSVGHVAYLLILEPSAVVAGTGRADVGGAALVLYLVVLTQLNDVSQFIFGKSFGRHKVVPKVSPGKTYEGLLGGVAATTTLAVVLAPWLTPFSWHHALLAGLIIGFGGFIGDVVISALKRDLAIKDSGSLLPGHGGILDRIDSLTYTAPLFFHFTSYLYY
ncbi:MAG TPA: phosphatidate cytidylyltransferase [Thermoanaerobaculia bacterium]|nr:phosphatidate cytidylyltransferase [Thermoanaerobaculia bacterium]